MEAVGTLDIYGGTIFDNLTVLSNAINIFGGTYIGGDTDSLLTAVIDGIYNIKGGSFSSDIGFIDDNFCFDCESLTFMATI